jgi:hypothetical protein
MALQWFGINVDTTAVTPVPVGSAIKAADIMALRNEFSVYLRGLGMPVPAWTDPVLTPGSRIKAVHLQELRDAVK